jgi:hypothetical protein
MSRLSTRTTALALATLVACAGTAAWSAPARLVPPAPRPGPVLSTHLDYGSTSCPSTPRSSSRRRPLPAPGTSAAGRGPVWLARP